MNYKDFKIKNLVNAKNAIKNAYAGKYSIVQINVNNLEWAKAALLAAEENKSPVILGFSEGAIKYIGSPEVCSNLIATLIKALNITVEVIIHLDHGSSIEICQKAADAGFSSIMYDGSRWPIEKNVKLSKEAKLIAEKYDLSLEVEVGTVGVSEDGNEIDHGINYATIEDCELMVKATQPTMLAAALGSVHGHYHGAPNLNFERMEKIYKLLDTPLVLHGTSGIPDNQIKKSITCGTAKMNVNTEFQEVFFNATKKYINEKEYEKIDKGFDPRKLLKNGFEAMKKEMSMYIANYTGQNKSK